MRPSTGGRAGVGKEEWTEGEANPRFIVTSLKRAGTNGRFLYEKVYCARGAGLVRISAGSSSPSPRPVPTPTNGAWPPPAWPDASPLKSRQSIQGPLEIRKIRPNPSTTARRRRSSTTPTPRASVGIELSMRKAG